MFPILHSLVLLALIPCKIPVDSFHQVELLCDMVVPFEESAARDRDTTAKINKESVQAFVLSCLRAGVRLDLKPRKSSAGLVSHVRLAAAA